MSACKIMKGGFLSWNAGMLIVLFFSTLYPRLIFLGNFPGMDEGYYTWQLMRIHSFLSCGNGLPPDGTLALYPLLLSFLGYLPGSIFIWARLADLAVALVSGWLFGKILLRLCKNPLASLFLSFIFLGAMNIGPVTDGGFKNSIFISYAFFFLSFLLALDERKRPCWPCVGALAALGTLVREPLAIFACIGFFAIWRGWNLKNALRYACGILLTSVVIILLIGLARGNLLSPVLAYLHTGGVYAIQTGQVVRNFCNNGSRALLFFSGPLLVVLYSFFIPKNRGAGWETRERLDKGGKNRQLFWIAAALLPLLEPALKIGFLYHFAQCLPGLGGLAALNWRVSDSGSSRAKVAWAILTLAVFEGFIFLPEPARLKETIDALHYIGEPWHGREAESNTMLAAKIIKNLEPAKGSLSSSGFTYFLYGSTGRMPPLSGKFDPRDAYSLSDLGRSFRSLGKDQERLAAALRMNPPDIIAIGYAVSEHEPTYHDEVLETVRKCGLYREAAKVDPEPGRNYGWTGYTIFVRLQVPTPES